LKYWWKLIVRSGVWALRDVNSQRYGGTIDADDQAVNLIVGTLTSFGLLRRLVPFSRPLVSGTAALGAAGGFFGDGPEGDGGLATEIKKNSSRSISVLKAPRAVYRVINTSE